MQNNCFAMQHKLSAENFNIFICLYVLFFFSFSVYLSMFLCLSLSICLSVFHLQIISSFVFYYFKIVLVHIKWELQRFSQATHEYSFFTQIIFWATQMIHASSSFFLCCCRYCCCSDHQSHCNPIPLYQVIHDTITYTHTYT